MLIEAPETAAPLVDIGAALAASREHSQLILCHLVAQEHDTRLEVATGLGGELRETTRTTGNLQALADRASARGVSAVVRSRFSQDIAAELPGYVAAAEPDTIVLGPGGAFRETLAADGAVQLVTVLRSLPEAPSAVAALWTRGEGGAAAVLVAAQLAVADRLKLVISPAGGRRAGLAAGLTRDGIAASDGPPPSGAIVVAAAADSSGDAHLTVRAGTREASDDLDQWVQDLSRSRLIGQRLNGRGRCARASPTIASSADSARLAAALSTLPLPEWMPSDGEVVAVRVLSGAKQDTTRSLVPPVTCSVRLLYAGCHERTLVRR